jgi:hypothetical protein
MPNKEQYEIEKLKLEIEKIKKPAWKRIETWNFLIPSLIALGSLILLYVNGAFDFRTKQLEATKDNLEWAIKRFSADTIGFHFQKDSLQNEGNILQKVISRLTKERSEAIKQNQFYDSLNRLSRQSIYQSNKALSDLAFQNRQFESSVRNLSDSAAKYKTLYFSLTGRTQANQIENMLMARRGIDSLPKNSIFGGFH